MTADKEQPPIFMSDYLVFNRETIKREQSLALQVEKLLIFIDDNLTQEQKEQSFAAMKNMLETKSAAKPVKPDDYTQKGDLSRAIFGKYLMPMNQTDSERFGKFLGKLKEALPAGNPLEKYSAESKKQKILRQTVVLSNPDKHLPFKPKNDPEKQPPDPDIEHPYKGAVQGIIIDSILDAASPAGTAPLTHIYIAGKYGPQHIRGHPHLHLTEAGSYSGSEELKSNMPADKTLNEKIFALCNRDLENISELKLSGMTLRDALSTLTVPSEALTLQNKPAFKNGHISKGFADAVTAAYDLSRDFDSEKEGRLDEIGRGISHFAQIRSCA